MINVLYLLKQKLSLVPHLTLNPTYSNGSSLFIHTLNDKTFIFSAQRFIVPCLVIQGLAVQKQSMLSCYFFLTLPIYMNIYVLGTEIKRLFNGLSISTPVLE